MYKEIAARLAGLRDALELSTQEMAQKTNIDTALYEQYETGTIDIPMNYLERAAKAFDLDATVLITGNESHTETFSVTRKGFGIAAERSKAYKYRNLAGSFKHAKATPFMVSVEPNDKPITLNSHPGQEFNLVEKGKMLLQIADKEIILNKGDSILFDATQPHGMKALENEKVRFLAIII